MYINFLIYKCILKNKVELIQSNYITHVLTIKPDHARKAKLTCHFNFYNVLFKG